MSIVFERTGAAIKLHPDDNVAIVRSALSPGDSLESAGVVARDNIAPGHKVALARIDRGEPIVKLGVAIGLASEPIEPGAHVHVHNVVMPDRPITTRGGGLAMNDLPAEQYRQRTFQGYLRPGGRAGTRNYIGILPTVNCSATVARMIAGEISSSELAAFPNVDGVVALTHGHGCSVAAFADGYQLIQRTLAGYARHPNFAAVLVVGLGCEDNHVRALMSEHQFKADEPVHFLDIQETGGTRRTVEAGAARIRELLVAANSAVREPLPISQLVLALQCGGSDGYSALSANPALGVASDLLVGAGGASILSETSEIYGAEHLLKARAISAEVAKEIDVLIDWWLEHAAKWGGSLGDNPTAGNNDGGLTTIIEKSLGSASKGGHAPIADVIRYGEPLRGPGLTFMDSPGNDAISVTGQVATGANMICFTTGRGSVFGCRPVPSLKLATNSRVYERMIDDMDINCGEVIDGTRSLEEMGEDILEAIIAAASGRKTKSEDLGFGHEEMVPWVISGTI